MIPDDYIKDIRIRLSYYKALAEIESTDDLDKIEDELRDQFLKQLQLNAGNPDISLRGVLNNGY